MLKLHYDLGPNLDRQIEAGARQLARVFETASRNGYLTIASYPNLQSIATGSVMFYIAGVLKIRPIFLISIDKPDYIDLPTILLGYNDLNYKTSEIDAPLIAFSSEIKSNPIPDTVYIDGDGSIPAMVGLTLLATGGVLSKREALGVLAASLYLGDHVDRRGRFYGVDSIFVERVSVSDKLDLQYFATLKAYNIVKYRACRSISITSNPFYPHLTGDEEECRKTLLASGLSNLSEKKIIDMNNKELHEFSTAIFMKLANVLQVKGKKPEEEDYIGTVLVSPRDLIGISDYRMAGDIITHIVETMGVGQLLSFTVNFYEEYPIGERILEDYSKRISKLIEEAKPKRIKSAPWFKAFSINANTNDNLLLLWNGLRITGYIDRDSVIAIEEHDELLVSGFQVEAALGPYSIKRLVEAKVLEEVDERLYRIAKK